MARITVDDCLDQIPNRFQLTLVAAYRARQLHNGSEPLINVQGLRDKPTVLALRLVRMPIHSLPNCCYLQTATIHP